MSSNVFPSLPGLDPAVERIATYKTTIHESVSGKEQRTSWESTPRYTYKLTFNVVQTAVSAPAPYGSYNEVSILLQFLDDHKGSWDSFLFNDPYSGTSTRVRFVEDSLTIQQIVPGVWQCQMQLISVK